MKILNSIFFLLCLGLTTITYTIDGDFGRRFGSGSRELQRPLFYKPYIKCNNKKCMYYKKRCDKLERQYNASLNQVCELEKIAADSMQESDCVKQQLANVQFTLQERHKRDQQQMQQIQELETKVAALHDVKERM